MTGHLMRLETHLKVVTEPHFKRLLRQLKVTLQEMNLLMAQNEKLL